MMMMMMMNTLTDALDQVMMHDALLIGEARLSRFH
jgi:hypothetical protein